MSVCVRSKQWLFAIAVNNACMLLGEDNGCLVLAVNSVCLVLGIIRVKRNNVCLV